MNLAATASQVFSFLEQHQTCSIERREIHSADFGALRRSVRSIVAKLSEDGDTDSLEAADRLRILLSEWLTVPVRFDGAMLESISALGDPQSIERRWGREIRTALDFAGVAASAIAHAENPVRKQVRDAVQHLRSSGYAWRIYCHRGARVHFESIFEDAPIPPGAFLHSARDYREVEPFEVLIKVGPLRSKSWSSAPDAILSAPRFTRLFQIVWSGCGDEEGFGYDPVVAQRDITAATGSKSSEARGGNDYSGWTRDVIHVGDSVGDPVVSTIDSDELRFFHELARASEVRRATLLQIDAEDGVLYPPHAQVPTFDPAASSEEPVGHRSPSETLAEGMFLIWPILGAADLGALRASEGSYSRTWKERLREEVRRSPDELQKRLRTAGIELRNLGSCVRQWCRPPSTVIHAPQQRRHFEILIRVLGIDHDATANARVRRRPWWDYAWSEIGHARGEAIQTGIQEQEIVDEQLFVILTELLPEMRGHAGLEDIFQIEIPEGKSLTGAVRFYKVRSIEDGFLVPDTIIKVICDLATIEQWRI